MTDKELIKNCIRGKKEAQYLLYQQFAATMLGVCYRYTKSLDDAEDVLQEGFIKVFTKINQFKNEGELGAWIRKIMVNSAINYIQKHNRYRKELQTEDKALHIISDDNPEINLDIKDLVELIRLLPGNYQIIFNLIAVEGYDYKEVCDLLNMNINTARSIYSRARTMLIQLIKKSEIVTTVNYEERIGEKY